MENLVTLSALELERLLITIESSQQVHRRYQYFLWSQGVLQSFLPHDLLIFGYGEYGAPGFRCEVLARANDIVDDHVLNRELDHLVQLMVESWRSCGHLPRVFNASADEGCTCAISQALGRLGLGHALAHGAKEFPGESSGFFVFLRMPEQPGKRHAYFVEMLMPYLHTTLHRMLISEKAMPERRLNFGPKLSFREVQVVNLVRDGKTNRQIAEMLGLSPLTIKNHIQNILRKLAVSNRAQAVAKAVKTRLIDEGPSS